MREIQRNIHCKTAKYHLLLALTDSIIFIHDFLIMVRTYKSINHLPQLQCIPETKCQSQGQNEHQTLPGKNWHRAFSFNWLPSTLSSGRHYTSLHWTTFSGTFFYRLNFKIQVSNNHLKMVLICTSPFYLHLTYNHSKNDCVNWNFFLICFLKWYTIEQNFPSATRQLH